LYDVTDLNVVGLSLMEYLLLTIFLKAFLGVIASAVPGSSRDEAVKPAAAPPRVKALLLRKRRRSR
jgi:hypothetical protein